jgi:hypothetical protein
VGPPRGGKGTGRSGSAGRGRGRAPTPAEKSSTKEKKALNATLELVKDKIHAEMKKQEGKPLDPSHSLIKERNSLLGELKKLKTGSNRPGGEETSPNLGEKENSSDERDPQEEEKEKPGSKDPGHS